MAELTPERWAEVERLFDAVADMPPSERARHLAQACGRDHELLAYIEALARSDAAKDTIIEESIRGILDRDAADAASSAGAVGERIGPYRVTRVLGSGGMGVVYLAERADEQFRQQVAIKVVRQRLVDPQIEARLVGERQILANLDHPNIARLLDGGTTADGTPYLVMEYIAGIPIDEYCDACKLTINERLCLFRTICSAVHYAHQNLVVHRDIKASNILVTEDGTPKLLDFGIAKLLDAGGTATEGLTRIGAVMMTPENAAPEQVLNRPVTTATDTYALGLLLYRLLTGCPPYRIGPSPSAIARTVCEQVPDRPSATIARLAGEQAPEPGETPPAKIARYRATTLDRLRRRLGGDLDNIVLHALRKEPERRYRSVNEFSEDIRLHLASLPVLARPDTWRYRSGKFLRRHVVGVAMSSAVVALLLTFAVAMIIQNNRVVRERDTAMQVSTFLEQIFMAPDPGIARGLDVTAQEILAKGAARIRDELGNRPEIRASLMATIGRVYFNLGEYAPSIDMLEEALAIRLEVLGDGHPEIAASRNDLAVSLTRTADYERAQHLLEQALAQNRRYYGDRSPQVAENLHNLAELHQATGNSDEAERHASMSVAVYSGFGDRHAVELAEAKNTLARILRGRNELDGAETLQREALALVREHLGEDHPFVAYYLQNLAVVLQEQGKLDAAEAMFNESIAVTRKVLGEEHDLLGSSLVMLGTLFHNRESHAAAESSFRAALAVHEQARGAKHPFVAYDKTRLGMLLQDMGELDEAEALLRDALHLFEEALAPDHQYVASALTELSAVLTERGQAHEAEPLLRRALEIRQRDYPETDPLVAATVSVYGHTLARLGRTGEAERLLLASLANLQKPAAAPDRRTRRALGFLASLYEETGRPDDALPYRQLAAAPPATTPMATSEGETN